MSRNPFARPRPSKAPYRRFLVVCEGEKSEPSYLEGVRSICRGQLIQIKIVGGAGATKKVVEQAVLLKKEAQSRAKRLRDGFENYDDIWCVLDVDDHDRLSEALVQARHNKIEVALSNPCYELWVVLHHRDERRSIHRAKLQSECKEHYKCGDKHVAFDKLWSNYSEARDRAIQLRRWQTEMGRDQGDPWTNFDELIDALLTLRKTKP
jgi:hypothetical protein